MERNLEDGEGCRMSRYKHILFDVDDTLLNFKEGQDNALVKLFADQGMTLTPALYQDYLQKNEALWRAFEA